MPDTSHWMHKEQHVGRTGSQDISHSNVMGTIHSELLCIEPLHLMKGILVCW